MEEKIYQSTEKLINTVDTTGSGGGVDNYALSRTGSEKNFDLYSMLPRNRRPVSMFVDPWFVDYDAGDDGGYTSLPPDLINQITPPSTEKLAVQKTCWEAEDADDFIVTLDESAILDIESLENVHAAAATSAAAATGTYGWQDYPLKVAVDVHKAVEVQPIYATVQKKTGVDEDSMERIPKIMTTSCYGGLGDTQILSFNQTTDIVSMTNSIADEYSSMSSSIFEPNSLISSIDARDMNSAGRNDKGRVKWWDENHFIHAEVGVQEIANQDLAAIRKILENETGGVLCPSCQMPFDKGKKRKLIDTCGHERCYSCMFRNEACPLCRQQQQQHQQRSAADNDDILNGCSRGKLQQHNGSNNNNNSFDYDTGIGSTTTLMSPVGSPQPVCRSHVKTNGHFTSYMQSRSELSSPSPELGKLKSRPPKCPSPQSQCCRRIAEVTATPPLRRRIFPRTLRSPFGKKAQDTTLSGLAAVLSPSPNESTVVTRRETGTKHNRDNSKFNRLSLGGITTTSQYAGHLSSLVFGKIKSLWSAESTQSNVGLNMLADDEGGNVKPVSMCQNKSKVSQDELQVRLGFFLENKQRNGRAPIQSLSSLTSANTSPVSTLTGSSEADVSRVTQESGQDSIGSLMSVSVSGSNASSSSPVSRRHSVTTSQSGTNDELAIFKTRKTPVRRSARSGQVRGPVDPRVRFAQYRQHQLTLKPIFFEVPLQESDPLYVGRQWLLRELAAVISAPECSGVLISGHLGTGKTALMLQLVDFSCFGRRKDIPDIQENDGIYCQINVAHDRIKSLASQVVAYHFCQADYNTTCLIPDFVHSIAAQLCQAPAFTAYHEFLLNEPHLLSLLTMKECIADPERALKQGILEPLAGLRRIGKIQAKNYVILIDALCEAEYHRPDHGDTIASFLAEMTEFFPTWLKVIATVRTQMLEFTKCLPYSKISLDSWNSNEALPKDMLDYISYRVNHSPSVLGNIGSGKETGVAQFKFAQHLLSLTKGSFLFAKLTLDLIERRNLVIKSSSYKVLPVSLAQIYLLSFNLRFPSVSSYEKVLPILSVCLAALYPLTLVDIYYSVNALLVEAPIEWEEFLDRFKTLTGFLIKRLDNTYMFFHPSFREWLIRRDDGESSKFLIDLRQGHAAIAFRLCRLQTPLDAEQTLELGHHILKAHLYRNAPATQSPRDLQAAWVAGVTQSASEALCTLRNVYSPNVKVSRLMLLAGASPDHRTSFLGNAPILCIAAHEGILSMVNLLIEFGADVEQTNSQGSTALILSASKGYTDVVRQLVAAGSYVGQVDTTNRCALVHAAFSGHLKVVKYLTVCEWTTRLETTDVTLRQAMQQAYVAAAGQGHTAIVDELLDLGDVPIDMIDQFSGETAMTAAAVNGHTDTVSLLLSRGATADVKNKKEWSPLLMAVKEGHWGIVERLLVNFSDPEQTDVNGKTALMIAAEEGHVGIIELLLGRGAKIEKSDNDGLTALCWACLRGKLQSAKRLLEEKANKQHADSTGRTPLDLAAYQGSATLVQLLIDSGAVIEHVDINGMRPLDRAIAVRNVQVVQVFLKRGAKLGPATWAMAAGKPEILLILLNKLLEDGNILYRKNRLQEASHRYQYALKKIPLGEQLENTATFVQLKFNFLLNLSRCKRKMNDAAEAIDLAAQAIELKSQNYDGYYARAKASMEVGSFTDALLDAKSALERSKNQSIDIKEALIRLHDDLAKRCLDLSSEPKYTELTDL